MAGLKIFGSGGDGGLGQTAIGAAGGFLTAGPIGAIAGGLSGLLGSGDQTQTTNYQYSSLTEGQQRLSGNAEGLLGRLLSGLEPNAQADLIASLTGELQGLAERKVGQTFDKSRSAYDVAGARSGGLLSSVRNEGMAALAEEEANALESAMLNARLGAEEIGASRHNQTVAGAGTALNTITGLEGTRRLLSQTGVARGNTTNDVLGGVMGAVTNPLSAYNAGTGAAAGLPGGGRYSEFLDSILKG